MHFSSEPQVKTEIWRNIQLFLIGLGFVLAAKGIALFPLGYSVDSYPKLVAMSEDTNAGAGTHAELLFRELMGQGRIGQWALNEALAALGIIGPGGNTLYVLLAMCCYVGVGVLLCRLWRIDDSLGVQVCIVAVFALHPYHAEIFTFREATLTVGLALLLSMLGIVVAKPRPSQWVIAITLIVLSLTLYQVAINYVIIALAILSLLELTPSCTLGTVGGANLHTRTHFPQQFLARTSAVVAAVILYLPIYKLSQASVSHTEEHTRGDILPLVEMPERVWHSIKVVGHVFLSPEPIMPITVKLLILTLSALAIGLLARKIWGRANPQRYMMLAIVLSILGLAGFFILGITIPLKNWQVSNRTLSAVSVLLAGFLALVAKNGGARTTRAVFFMVYILLFSFVGVNNVVFSEQLRLNQRDLATASRMISRLEANAKFKAVKKIVVIGFRRDYALRFLTAEAQSAFSQPWSKANIIQEISGYKFQSPSPENISQAEDYCRDVQPWPDRTSITVLGDTGVICLSNNA